MANDLKPYFDQIRQQVDLHELARRLGLVQPGGRGNYKSPHHDDKSPSLGISKSGRSFTDYSADGAPNSSGGCFDLVQYVHDCDFMTAVAYIECEFGFTRPTPDAPVERKKQTTEEWIAEKCLEKADQAIEWLTDVRKIPVEIVERAIARKSLGFNDYTNPKANHGDVNYGGPAVGFIVRTLNPGRVIAIDHRYIEPEANGGVKTKTKGDKFGHPWYSSLEELNRAHTVYVCESAINALTIEAAQIPGSAALAIRGTGNVDNIDWRFLQGKRVIAVMDYDEPNRHGKCPGQSAMWRLHEACLSLNIACLSIDQDDWPERGLNDINDLLQLEHVEGVRIALKRLEQHLIPGKPGDSRFDLGKTRVFLPGHDSAHYWRFRVKEDFTSFVKKEETDEDGNKKPDFADVCGFRIAGLSRVTVASSTSATSGEADHSPTTLFAVSVQTPRHKADLVRRVFRDEDLHNLDRWRKFGPVYAPQAFARMVNILERTADIGARDAVNFVGLAFRDGKPVVNEGADCYFTDPDKQCPYHNLRFISGSTADAVAVLKAYNATFKHNAALLTLVWALGAHLKVFLGYWPHMQMQARKGAGKTTLLKRLERTIGFTLFGSEQVKTDFRQLTSVSHTSHPVGWEEFSTIPQRYIDTAVGLLQQAYQFVPTTRGSDMTQYLISAPVLMGGEDVPVRSIIGKMVRTDLREQGTPIPDDLVRFPVREWLTFLAGFSKPQIRELAQECRDDMADKSMGSQRDAGARRMVENYGAVLLAWRLLTKFCDIARETGQFEPDLVAMMNTHIAETEADREPWVWILETALNQLDRGEYRYPSAIDTVEGNQPETRAHERECLVIRHTHVIDQLKHTPALRPTFDGLPVKTPAVFKSQLIDAGVVHALEVERTIGNKRWAHMMALDIEALGRFGLSVPREVPAAMADSY